MSTHKQRNLSYFASKTSPTWVLLLYLEAISEIRACELNGLNYEHYIQEVRELEMGNELNRPKLSLPVSQNHEAVFQQSRHFLDSVKTNRKGYGE